MVYKVGKTNRINYKMWHKEKLTKVTGLKTLNLIMDKTIQQLQYID